MKDTVECIHSIRKLHGDYRIIVVDNNSETDDGINKLKGISDDVIALKENLGFANGNNAGCRFAIEKYKPDFLCVINNDTIIYQEDFLDEIVKTYDKIKFDIMGPKIITENGESVNPFPVYSTLEEVNRKIRKHKMLIFIYHSLILRNLLIIYSCTKQKIVKKHPLTNGNYSQENIALHGCALIFSKKYYSKYKNVFYEGTFLYHEEEFLNYRRIKDNLVTYYNSNLEIFHKEGSSLEHNFQKNFYKKLIFKNREIVKSLTLLKEVMEKNIDI